MAADAGVPLRFKFTNWENHFHGGTPTSGGDLQAAAELLDALGHAREADAKLWATVVRRTRTRMFYTYAFVPYFQADFVLTRFQMDQRFCAFRVPLDI